MADSDQTTFSFEQILGVLRRRAVWIVACCLLVAGAAYGVSRYQTKEYTATAALVFGDNQLNEQVAGLAAVNNASSQAQQNTNVKLVQLGDMAEKTADILGLGLTKETVRESLDIGAQGESNVVNVSATSTSPLLAADIANTYTTRFVAEQQNANRSYYRAALALVNKQLAVLSPKQRVGAAGLALENRAQSLGVLAELRSGNVRIAQAAAIPVGPSSPKILRNTLLGGVLGLLLGLGVAFLLERLDQRVREPGDLENAYRLPLLGVVPEARSLGRPAKRRGGKRELLPPDQADVFHLVRARLRYFNVDRDLRTLLVASATPGDGKSTVARYLAAAAAMTGTTVLLLEADLRRPTLAEQLDVRSGPGLSDVLIGSVSLWDATQSIPVEPGQADGEAGRGRTLDLLVAGASTPPNPSELIESRAMEAVLEQARATYQLVVVDTSPLAAVSDTFPLLRKVDGVVIVGRIGQHRRDIAQRLRDTLDGVGAPLLGVVANRVKPRGRGSYAYGYSYSPYRQPPDADQNPSRPAAEEPYTQPAAHGRAG